MGKIYNNLLKISFVLIITSLTHTSYAQNPIYMNEYCASHHSLSAQKKCAKYFEGYWYENENYYDDGPYNNDYPNSYYYYPYSYYYPNLYYYFPGNVIIENEE